MGTDFQLPVDIIFSFSGILLCGIIIWGFYNNIKQGQDRAKNMKAIGITVGCLVVCIAIFVFSVARRQI